VVEVIEIDGDSGAYVSNLEYAGYDADTVTVKSALRSTFCNIYIERGELYQ